MIRARAPRHNVPEVFATPENHFRPGTDRFCFLVIQVARLSCSSDLKISEKFSFVIVLQKRPVKNSKTDEKIL